jgi:putative Holliday junction resolvase
MNFSNRTGTTSTQAFHPDRRLSTLHNLHLPSTLYCLHLPAPPTPYTNPVPHLRTLALDVGDRRIGLAITDPLGLTAQPLFTLHRTTLRADLKSIARFIRQHKVEALLVGNPLHADGTPSPQAAKAQAFAQALQEAHPTLTHHLLDERLTTHDAHALLDLSGHTPRSTGHATRLHRKDIIDQVAATLLLESHLSTTTPTLLPDPEGSGSV